MTTGKVLLRKHFRPCFATLFFMAAVAGLGTIQSEFLPVRVSELLNLVIGAVLSFSAGDDRVRRGWGIQAHDK